ncbi:MAG TPA: acetamidase [Tissierellia bacterium]|nr:acetamidase [Tissierellia bacterium]
MKTITKDQSVYSLSPSQAVVTTISPGEIVRVETFDCFSATIASEQDLLIDLDFERVNPATGPLFIDGAEPGDVLEVEILRIDLADQAIMVVAEGEGFLGNSVKQTETRLFPVFEDHIELFSQKIPLSKMIGVIGTAPAEGDIPTGTPGEHGGNMDCLLIKEGASLFLPVAHPGALLSLGDLHAAMGDGEVSVSGAEVSGTVELRVKVLKDSPWPTPMVQTKDTIATIHSAETMEAAGQGALHKLIDLMVDQTPLSFNEAYMLLSAAGTLAVCQVVDPLVTMRMELPRTIWDGLKKTNPRDI